ncbi:MAG: DNA starvation/stationary phase protection protein [Oceanicaulis sp.]|jgi:starvation-inducible DNA-binding protein|uniref:Dps family protein n=1 Tax=unclassified Oceanicaulis TaxID=2632123 RepID=UPI000066D3DD|nr:MULTISPECIES: DNA starvation/stationary phase protection protein [unclassified Oceanicaulis]EAP91124.1 DpsA [Oceanicaulis sp. HTCC2633]MAB68081.1 DNA starvation/stationary phase protection protein [Oceanicaulis sp.]MBC39254.1 DNA starvation/stationary phase protection protein [Oceanicaulis sp.]MBG34507.1 DNA starvation/stationary phase protection protein [Oceanicaulis sp.]HBU62758.1 DNA starvation/stationary phase protection protein [Oceanicaulis sp.]|tara:strand:- start:157 stop:666 length:510 start_codon:yes stop_codon:yes gene_type:complete
MSSAALASKTAQFDQKAGIQPEDRSKIASELGKVLADSYMLFIKTQGVHWNVVGPTFYSLHKLTEEHYGNLYAAIDEIAERIRALGEKAPASYRKYGELSDIQDYDLEQTAEQHVKMLIDDHRTAVKSMRGAIEWCEDKKDFVTADMLIERMSWHEEAIWMLNSIIAEK